jgi:hypothetical protein
MSHLVALRAFRMLCCHHHYLVTEHFQDLKDNPILIKHQRPLPATGNRQSALYLYKFAFSEYFIHMESYDSFVSDFFHLAQCFQGLSMKHGSLFHSFYG